LLCFCLVPFLFSIPAASSGPCCRGHMGHLFFRGEGVSNPSLSSRVHFLSARLSLMLGRPGFLIVSNVCRGSFISSQRMLSPFVHLRLVSLRYFAPQRRRFPLSLQIFNICDVSSFLQERPSHAYFDPCSSKSPAPRWLLF